MKRLALALAVFAAPLAAQAGSYTIDPMHSTIEFSTKHMGVATVRGRFDKFSGTVDIDDKNPANNKVNITIDAASVNTGTEKRDQLLSKTPGEFFDSAKFPTATFVSKSVKSTGAGAFDVVGDLTLHGVTKPVTLKVTDVTADSANPMDKKNHRGASATATINRQDFGVKSGGPADVAVSNDVKLQIDVELVAK